MTYRELLKKIKELPVKNLDDTVTVYDAEEDDFRAVITTSVAEEKDNDILDPGHLFLVLA